jgi:hypothetical protein
MGKFYFDDRTDFFFGIMNYQGFQNNQVLLYDKFKPNIVVVWLTLLLHIWDVRCRNLGLETGYRDRFSSVSPG